MISIEADIEHVLAARQRFGQAYGVGEKLLRVDEAALAVSERHAGRVVR